MAGTNPNVRHRPSKIHVNGRWVSRGNVKVTEADRNNADYGQAREHHEEMSLMPASKGNINGWFRKISRHIDEDVSDFG